MSSQRRIRASLLILLAMCALLSTACQWVQNEFFTLDRARPEPAPSEQTGQTW